MRQRDTRAVGRIHVSGFHDSELFYLRRLLCVIRGATCWDDVRSFDGVSYPTFKEACSARCMLLDDSEYVAAMQALCDTNCSQDSLRHQFVCLLVNCQPTNSSVLFEMFLPEFCGCDDPQHEDVQNVLWAMEGFANSMGASVADFGFPIPSPRMIVNYPADNIDVHCHNRDVAFAQFSQEQLSAAEHILTAAAAGLGALFYLQASGGCGKSFWANGVSAALHAQGHQPTVVAASGLAAQILIGGRTAHKALGIPLDVDENSYCHVDADTRNKIINSNVLLWDECSMVHKDVADTVNRSFQDYMGTTELFGGKIIVFMGDFQQLLPVVRGGSGDTATLLSAPWWKDVRIMHLTRNYRSDDPGYCAMLRQVGVGDTQDVAVPQHCVSTDLDDFCFRVFGDYSQLQRHVVCLTLQDAATINSFVMRRLPGHIEIAAAVDDKVDCKDPDLYSDEYLQSLHIPGMPPALLECKEGARCGPR